jgi:hypothetical protein
MEGFSGMEAQDKGPVDQRFEMPAAGSNSSRK